MNGKRFGNVKEKVIGFHKKYSFEWMDNRMAEWMKVKAVLMTATVVKSYLLFVHIT